MKYILPLLGIIYCSISVAQTGADCETRIQNTKGTWRKGITTNKAPAADAAREKQFLDAVHKMLQPYNPMGLTLEPSFSLPAARSEEPVNAFTYSLMAFHFSCSGTELSVAHETATRLDVMHNYFSETPLYDTSTDMQLTGYFDLRHGLPTELRPGIWQFPDEPESLGFGRSGTSKLWLITWDGKLPWAYVSRREFLNKRKRILVKELAGTEATLKEQLNKWEKEKKEKEEELKNDQGRLSRYLDNTYKPGVERERLNHQKTVTALQKSIDRVNDQLMQADLEKPAIVIRNQQSLYDYDFVEKPGPFTEVLTKPNPAYFNRKLPRSIPQFISVEIIYDHTDPMDQRFAENITSLLHLDYLKSTIGKNGPGTSAAAAPLPASSKAVAQSQPEMKAGSGSNAQATSPQKTAAAPRGSAAPAAGDAKATGAGNKVSGIVSAPAGTFVTLTLNGTADLALSIPRPAQKQFASIPFSFAKVLADNTSYQVSIKAIPGNMRGVLYHGSGVAPAGMDKLEAGVDFKFDLISRSSDDKVISGFYESGDIAIGGYEKEEGRYVAFVSLTAGLEGNNGKYRQIFWRDRNTGLTKLVSRSPAGELGNADSYAPSLSADGKWLVFESNASNLVEGDNNSAKDVFVWNAQTNNIQLVSRSADGGFGDAESFDPSISGNGQFVVFTSTAANLTSIPKAQSVYNVFVRDLANGKTEMVSVHFAAGVGGNGGKGSISFDGSRISFCSSTQGLVKDDANSLWDIFLWQRGQKELRRISLTHDGKERNQGVESATRFVASAISGNGRYVAYATTATNMVPNDNNNYQDVFVFDTETNQLTIVSQTNDGQPANNDSPIEQAERVAISYDGTWIAFPTKASNLGAPASNIVLHNLVTGKKQVVSTAEGSYVGKPAISYHGSYVLFACSARLDSRFSASGIFASFTGNGPCRSGKD